MPWLRQLAAGLLPRKPAFDPRPVRVVFVMGKMALGQVFLPVIRFFFCHKYFQQYSMLVYLMIMMIIIIIIIIIVVTLLLLPIPVAARSKAWVCGRSRAGIAGSNPAGGIGVCLL